MADYPDYLQDEEDSPEARAAKAQFSALQAMSSGKMPEPGTEEYSSGRTEHSDLDPVDWLVPAAVAKPVGKVASALTDAAYAGGKAALPELGRLLGDEAGQLTLGKKALDMSEAARMARAKEMGFDPNKTWYHTTPTEIKKFKQKGPHNPEVTAFFTPDKKFANQWVYEQGENGEGANIIPAYLKTQKTFDPGNPQHLEEIKEGLFNRYKDQVMKEEFDPSDARFQNLTDKEKINLKIKKINNLTNEALDQFKRYDWTTIEQPENLRLLKGAGFDSTLLKEEPGNPFAPKNIAIFNPHQIRSKFAAFDPAKASSGDLAASLAGAGLSLPALKALLEKNKTSKDEL